MDLLLKKHVNWIADVVDEAIDAEGIVEMLDRPVTKGFVNMIIVFERKKNWIPDDEKTAIHGAMDSLMEGDIISAVGVFEPIADKYINFKNIPDEVEASAFAILFSVIKTVIAALKRKEIVDTH